MTFAVGLKLCINAAPSVHLMEDISNIIKQWKAEYKQNRRTTSSQTSIHAHSNWKAESDNSYLTLSIKAASYNSYLYSNHKFNGIFWINPILLQFSLNPTAKTHQNLKYVTCQSISLQPSLPDG